MEVRYTKIVVFLSFVIVCALLVAGLSCNENGSVKGDGEEEATEESTPTPTPTPTPIEVGTSEDCDDSSTATGSYTLVATVESDSDGFFGGDAANCLDLIVIGPYVEDEASGNVTFFNADGEILSQTPVGGSCWAADMTPDGSKTVVGCDDELLYIFSETTLMASGRPTSGNGQIRGVAISDDGRYAGAGGFRFTLHDLSASDPITPIYEDNATDQVRAIDFSSDGRYVAYGGQIGFTTGGPYTMYLGIYDLQEEELVFTDTISYPDAGNAELRHLSISSDGNKIVAGNWAHHILYYVRSDASSAEWDLVQDIEVTERVYSIDMDSADSLVVVGIQDGRVRLYSLGDTELTLEWEKTGSDGIAGGPRYVSITEDGSYVTAGTRGGCDPDGGGQALVFDRAGDLVFTERGTYRECTTFGSDGNPLTASEVWFVRITPDGGRIVFAGWGGYAYFYEVE
jgi:WD40 repeat protein